MRAAFSLVELSIVLVILGLLTGGILAGQSLIRAAEIRSVASDISRYRTAFASFRDKYFALPGDMRNAVKFWGAAAGGTADGSDATCAALTTASTTTATCNGDGDGQITHGGITTTRHERHRAWQHLANAGLIEGGYTGVAGPGSIHHSVAGLNAPAGRISSSGFSVVGLNYTTSNTLGYFPGVYNNVLVFGGSTATDQFYGPIIKPEEAWNIDTKTDDGKPSMGQVLTVKKNGNALSSWIPPESDDCATTDVVSTAEYDLSASSNSCFFYIKTGF